MSGQLLDTGTRWAIEFTDKEDLVRSLIISGRLGYSDHGIVECIILRGKVADRVQTISRDKILNYPGNW